MLWGSGHSSVGKKLAVTLLAFFLFTNPLTSVFANEAGDGTAAVPASSVSSANMTVAPASDTRPLDSSIDTTDNAAQDYATRPTEEGEPSNAIIGAALPNRLTTIDHSSGACVYDYHISVPPGRNGLQPDLSLSYNSQNNENVNLVGYGWSINIPFIERLNKKGTDQLYAQNYFSSSLSGELDVLTSGTFGSKIDNGEFLSYSISNNVWTVKDKKGAVYKFGNTADARLDNPSNSTQVHKWMLEEVRDTNDNYIKYTYYKDSGQIYPSSIFYTGNGTTDGIFEIEFVRTSRSDAVPSYKTQFLVTTNYRITEIQIKVNASWVRRYALSYITGDNGVRSLLSSITESGRDGLGTIITLPATRFNYQTSTSGWSHNSITFFSPIIINQYRVSADLSGDGYTDIINSIEDNFPFNTRGVYRHSGHTQWFSDFTLTFPLPIYKREIRGGAYNYLLDNGVRLADVNGDQYSDILVGLDAYQTFNGSNYTAYLNNSGAGWTQASNWAPTIGFSQTSGDDPQSTGGSINDYGARVLDLNGDGLPDIS